MTILSIEVGRTGGRGAEDVVEVDVKGERQVEVPQIRSLEQQPPPKVAGQD